MRRALAGRRGARRREDGGFTLLELMICVGILGLIMGAIGASFWMAMNTQRATQTRLDVSHDAQMVSAVFTQDIAGATTVKTTGSPNCGTLGSGAGAYTLVIDLVGGSFEPAAIPTAPPTASPAPVLWPSAAAITYVTRPVTVSGVNLLELHRWVCPNGTSTSVVRDEVVARQLNTTNGVVAICRAANNYAATVSCNAASVASVTLTLTSRSINPPVRTVTTAVTAYRRAT